jgi:Bacteriophytochrome (light-regulated signal transduction histidine kinase)
MNIRAKLRLTMAISIGTAVVVGAVMFLSLQKLNTVRGEAAQIQTLQKEVAELHSTTFEYLTYHEQRMYLQWLSKHAKITKLLDGLREEHKEPAALIEEIRQNHKKVGALFDRMTGSMRETRGNGPLSSGEMRPEPSTRERETILGGQLQLRAQYIMSNLLRLSAHTGSVMADAQKKMALAVVLSVLLLVVVKAVASLTIMKSLVKPIDELRRGTERVGAGDLDFRIGTKRGDEIGQLSRSFDAMAERLKAITVSRDVLGAEVAQRKRAEEEVRKLNEELEDRVKERTAQLSAINKELEAFSYSVSHDLRAPLRHVSGYIDLLRRKIGPQLDEKGRHYIEMIIDSGEKMGRLIDDLLAFSRMGRTEMRCAAVPLGDILEDVLKDLRGEMQGRKIAWEIDTLPKVYADASMLRLALTNLVSNAIKFTRRRSDARIRVGYTDGADGEVVVFVKDNGAGFDMKYVDKLFGVFQRLHPTEEFEGTGIGLANVRRIIHRHGGKTWAEGAVGEGATFYFTIQRHREET